MPVTLAKPGEVPFGGSSPAEHCVRGIDGGTGVLEVVEVVEVVVGSGTNDEVVDPSSTEEGGLDVGGASDVTDEEDDDGAGSAVSSPPLQAAATIASAPSANQKNALAWDL